MDYNEILNKYLSFSKQPFILKDLIYSYKNHLFKSKKLKNKTISEMIYILENFDKFLSIAYPNLSSYKDIKDLHIHTYKKFLSDYVKNQNDTVNKKLRAIRGFFEYLSNYRHLIEYNIALKVPYLPFEEKLPPNFIPLDKLKIIIKTFYNFKYGIRDVCIIKFIAFAGLRLQEVFQLKVNDIDIPNKSFSILRDNQKYTFAIPDSLYNDLISYLELRRNFTANNNSNYLFLSQTGNQYNIRAFQYRFKTILNFLDFPKYTPRNIRASFCYYMAKKIDKEKMKEILNQKNVEHYFSSEILNNPLSKL